MEGNLVIVESPAKAGTIQKFLGKDYIVKPSFGHIRDLQDKKLSVDVEHGFQPEYVIPADKKKVVSELKKLASEAQTVWLASDEDREGEAISWHLYETLGLKKENTKRIVFHEITQNAILHAIETPRDIDMNLVDAQQARRVLDRLVGFELSPILWRKIQPKPPPSLPTGWKQRAFPIASRPTKRWPRRTGPMPGSVFITPPTWVNGWWYAPAGRNTPPPRKNW